MEENDLVIEDILANVNQPKKRKNSKKKGNRVELSLCKLLTEHFGCDFSRSVGSGNRWSQVGHMPEHAKKTLVGDICVPEEFSWVIECKGGYEDDIDLNNVLRAIPRLDSFIEQSEQDEKQSGRKPIICWKRNRKDWIAMVKKKHLPKSNFEYIVYYRDWRMVLLTDLLNNTERNYWFKNE